MNKLKLKHHTKVDFATYAGVIAAFLIVTFMQSRGLLGRSTLGLLVPICCYVTMAISRHSRRAEPRTRGLYGHRRIHRRYRKSVDAH